MMFHEIVMSAVSVYVVGTSSVVQDSELWSITRDAPSAISSGIAASTLRWAPCRNRIPRMITSWAFTSNNPELCERLMRSAIPSPGAVCPGDGEVRLRDLDGGFEFDRPACVENDDTRPSRAEGGAQATGSGVVKVRDVQHLPTALARGGGAESLSTGE
jgi:hypothetical protein